MCGQSLAGLNSRNCDPVCRSGVLFVAVLVNLPHAALGEILIPNIAAPVRNIDACQKAHSSDVRDCLSDDLNKENHVPMRPNFVRSTAPFRSSRKIRLNRISHLHRLALPLVLVASLSGCGSLFGSDEPDTSTRLGSVVGPQRNAHGLTGVGRASEAENLAITNGGFVLADEPQAALIARDVLERGGNAADAATALYFTLSVTYPAAAGLGGGGICLIHDPFERTTESVEFLPRRAAAGGPVAIPGNVRGFALLQARYGQSSWASLLAPAERLAATGTPVSRAMARGLAPHAAILRADPELSRGLLSRSGSALKEQDKAVQIELASTLGLVRSRGVAALYSGDGVATLAAGIADAGGRVSVEDLRNYRPVVSDAAMRRSDGVEVYFPSSNVGAGAFATAMWDALQTISPTDGTGGLQAANTTARSLGVSGTLPDDLGSTGFVVVSSRGNAVACAVTMNGPFGTGRTARGMGVTLASAPDEPVLGLAGAFLAPVIATGPGNTTLVFAGASGGGPNAVAGVQQVLRQTLGASPQNMTSALRSATPDASVLINALVCPSGLPLGFNKCEIGIDPDGYGLGVEAITQ